MNVKRFFSKRINILAFVTVIFILIGLLFGLVLPNQIFNNQIDAIEEGLHDLAIDHLEVLDQSNDRDLASTQVLYVYDNGDSTMLTSSGFIDVIDGEVENHLIHWSHEQVAEDIQAILYEDDFQQKNYIYYVYVLDDEYYVVSFEDTKEVIMFVDGFRQTSLIALFGFYLLSILFSSTVFSSTLVKQYSFFDPVTNLNTKVSLLNKYSKKNLTGYNITYFNIYNLLDIVNAIGSTYNEEILKMISGNLSRQYNADSIYQLSQSEYVLLEPVGAVADLDFNEVINRVDRKLNPISGYELKTKMINIDPQTLDNTDIDTVIKQFSFTFSKIKSSKQTTFTVNQEIINEMKQEQYYQSRLGNAIKDGSIINFYQPKVDPKTNKIIGAEALSRWQSEEGIISPGKYIHLAEANGMIYDIDMISFKNVVNFLKELRETGLIFDGFRVSTNFSPLSLKNVTFDQIKTVIEDAGVDPYCISFEITESVALEFDLLEELFKNLSEYGISIEIDDFSAGNSSFTMLPMLNANVVKLDRAILPEKEEDEKEMFIYNSLVDISKKLGMKIISEGVETDLQKTFVRELGVEGVQGYFYSKPLQRESFVAYMKEHK